MRMIGHNLNFGHSGKGERSINYADDLTGMMGYAGLSYEDEGPVKVSKNETKYLQTF